MKAFLSDLGAQELDAPAEALQFALDHVNEAGTYKGALIILSDDKGLRLINAGMTLVESLGLLTLAQASIVK